MRTSSAVKPDSSITADNHFHAARNSLRLRDSICPPYREFFDEEKIHSVQVDVSRIAACSADEEFVRIYCGPVAAALTVIETFEGAEARYANGEYVRLNRLHTQAARGGATALKDSK
jgi:hypothetical protein